MKNLDGFFGKPLAIFQSQRSTYNSQDEENDLELQAQLWVKIFHFLRRRNSSIDSKAENKYFLEKIPPPNAFFVKAKKLH